MCANSLRGTPCRPTPIFVAAFLATSAIHTAAAGLITVNWTRGCPPNGYRNAGGQPAFDFDLDGDGTNDSWNSPITMSKAGGGMYATTDAMGNSVILPCVPDPSGPGNGADFYSPRFRKAGGAKSGVEIGQCVYECGRNTWTLCFDDVNGDCIPDKFTKSTWVSKNGGGNWPFTGESTTFVADLTKDKIVPVRTQSPSPLMITDAVIVDAGTPLSSVTLEGSPIGLPDGQEPAQSQETVPPPLFVNTLMDSDQTFAAGDLITCFGMLTNLDDEAHFFDFSLFGVNATLLTTPSLLSVLLGPGQTHFYEINAVVQATGFGAVVSGAYVRGGNSEEFSIDASVFSPVPEPSGIALLAVGSGVLGLFGRSRYGHGASRAQR